MTSNKRSNQRPQPQPDQKRPPVTGNRTYSEDRKPQKIESVQPPRPQPGDNKGK